MKVVRKWTVGSLVTLFCALSAPHLQASPIQWIGNGHYYELFSQSITFAEAQALAAAKGGYLVTVTSAAENSFISALLGAENNAWLGAVQSASNPGYSEPTGGWAWLTGEAWAYTNWTNIACCQEPGDSFNGLPDISGNEDHVIMTNHFDRVSSWADVNGNNPGYKYFTIVESNRVPEPSTLVLLGIGVTALIAKRRHLGRRKV